MKKHFLALPVLVAAIATMAGSATASVGDDDPMIGNVVARARFQHEIRSRAARPGMSATSSDDTVWIGYDASHSRRDLTYNYWSIGAFTGAEGGGQARDQRGQWGFDPPYVDGDSLQGWWPVRESYATNTQGPDADYQRPWWAFDVGNNVNYAITGASGRTFGVVGMWHRDDAGPPVPASQPDGTPHAWNDVTAATPRWTVLEGSYSAWMGLRALHDVAFVDPITGQPFSGEARRFNSGGESYFGDFVAGSHGALYGNNSSFPGYMSQMDQMLYRDIDLSGIGSDDLNISFLYATEMSTGYNSDTRTRVGWFQYDPLQATFDGSTTSPNLAVGNFISSSDAGTNAPVDSFMVYIGAPVGSEFLASDGFTYAVFDPQRRWFSEVLDITGYVPGISDPTYIREIFSAAGSNPATQVNVTIPNALLTPILESSDGHLRLVFRVKTNRTWDDEHSSWTTGGLPGSGGKGAAQVDAVTYAFGAANSPPGWGDFESPGSIDNDLGVTALDAWKSTGKPPWSPVHPHDIALLPYDNLCGPVGAPTAHCDLGGAVLSFGDHDHSEASNSPMEGTADRNTMMGIYSPTILLATPAVGENVIGLDRTESEPTEDYYIVLDWYIGGSFRGADNYNALRVSCQSYPTLDRNGNEGWSTPTYPGYAVGDPYPRCIRWFDPLFANGMITTSNASGIPDSVVIGISKYSACYRSALPTCAFTEGGYVDNVSLAIVDGVSTKLSVGIWDWYNDTFPANETAGLPGTAGFDTTTAYTRVAVNIAQNNTSPGQRYMIPGDSVTVHSLRDDREMHLIFRILPGPGNYYDVGHPESSPASAGNLSGLRAARPGVGVGPADGIAATPGDPSDFFESYIADNGVHGTPGGHAGGRWDPNVWNSARCDTAGTIVFPQAHWPPGVTGMLDPSVHHSTYHESEVRGRDGNLGVRRLMCFFESPTSVPENVACETKFSGSNVPPHVATGGPTAPDAATGWPGAGTGHPIVNTGDVFYTVENTKVFPDGIFTPGTHIEYFFAEYEPGAGKGSPPMEMIPDTSVVFPQTAEMSLDAHRWQQFAVLPDLWKTDGYVHPVTGQHGPGLACMLVYDGDDRLGNERVWVGIADTIGATAVERQGAHNGWRATPADGGASINDPTYFVAAHLGQPGTSWDLYQKKAAETRFGASTGSIGVRLGRRTDGTNPQIGGDESLGEASRTSRLGPTPEMLNAYYKVMLHTTGGLSYVLGPMFNSSADDVGMLTAFLQGDPGAGAPSRGYWAIGEAFAEDAYLNPYLDPSVPIFVWSMLGVYLKGPMYQALAHHTGTTAAITPQFPITHGEPYGAMATHLDCAWAWPDVLEQSGAPGLMTENVGYYEEHGSINAPFPSGILKRWDETSKYVALTEGWDLNNLTGWNDVSGGGRLSYFYLVLQRIFGEICDLTPGPPIVALDVPNIADARLYDFARLRNNPVESGMANVHLGLANADRVEVRIFDVSGRLIRTLADRYFEAGEHDLYWDGADDGGRRVHRGVYFTKLRYAESGFTAKGKVVLLK